MAEKKAAAKKPAAKKPAAEKPVVKVIQAAERPLEPVVVEKVAIYRDVGGEWRWKAIAANGKVVADSAEGYNNKSYTIKVARSLHPGVKIELH